MWLRTIGYKTFVDALVQQHCGRVVVAVLLAMAVVVVVIGEAVLTVAEGVAVVAVVAVQLSSRRVWMLMSKCGNA